MQFVIDRTEADVLLGNPKGFYTYQDLNRVEQAVSELCAQLPRLDIRPGLTVKTDWSQPGTFSAASWPVQSQMQRYLQNVKTLCQRLGIGVTLPKSMENLTYTGANQIEKALQKADERVRSILQTYQFSGEVFAGEENIL